VKAWITDPRSSVGRLVAERPEHARLFERYGIEYSCNGSQTLAQACAERGVELYTVATELMTRDSRTVHTEDAWLSASLSSLIEHIVTAHHNYLRAEFPRLSRLIEKLIGAHGEPHPELTELEAQFGSLRQKLEPHMLKEEAILFPAIRLLERTGNQDAHLHGMLRNVVRLMEQEHTGAAQILEQIRVLTNGYVPHEDACPAYATLLDRLNRLEQDTHEHIHKENDILFPRVLAVLG
jgi:regulator of cell morphogenesis and NO signaling